VLVVTVFVVLDVDVLVAEVLEDVVLVEV